MRFPHCAHCLPTRSARWSSSAVGGWTTQASADLGRFVDANALTTAASFRCQDRLDNTHPCYAGDLGLGIDPALADRVRNADLLLVIGARLGEMTTRGYRLVTPPCPQQKIVHVYPDPGEIGRVLSAGTRNMRRLGRVPASRRGNAAGGIRTPGAHPLSAPT